MNWFCTLPMQQLGGSFLIWPPDTVSLIDGPHYNDVTMGSMTSQITSITIVYSAVYQRKHQSSASLAFVRGIHRGPVNSPHKWPVTRKMFPFDDVIKLLVCLVSTLWIRYKIKRWRYIFVERIWRVSNLIQNKTDCFNVANGKGSIWHT